MINTALVNTAFGRLQLFHSFWRQIDLPIQERVRIKCSMKRHLHTGKPSLFASYPVWERIFR